LRRDRVLEMHAAWLAKGPYRNPNRRPAAFPSKVALPSPCATNHRGRASGTRSSTACSRIMSMNWRGRPPDQPRSHRWSHLRNDDTAGPQRPRRERRRELPTVGSASDIKDEGIPIQPMTATANGNHTITPRPALPRGGFLRRQHGNNRLWLACKSQCDSKVGLVACRWWTLKPYPELTVTAASNACGHGRSPESGGPPHWPSRSRSWRQRASPATTARPPRARREALTPSRTNRSLPPTGASDPVAAGVRLRCPAALDGCG
jgi:hypothetical protein